jgi:hypothetical protein
MVQGAGYKVKVNSSAPRLIFYLLPGCLIIYLSYNFSGVAGDDSVWRDIFCHHAAGTNDRILADDDAG